MLDSTRLKYLAETVWSMPWISVSMHGDMRSWSMYEYFTGRHPGCPIFRRKEWGVALIEIPDDMQEFESGRKMQAFRTNRRRAIKAGYTFQSVAPCDYIDDIMSINLSAEMRQGRPMSQAYVDDARVQASWERIASMPAVMNE